MIVDNFAHAARRAHDWGKTVMNTLIGAVHEGLIFDRRARVLALHLSKLLPAAASVLDVGCGDGTIDDLIQRLRPDVRIRGVDVLARPRTRIPVELFNGVVLPYDDNSIDVVSFVDVLHHTDNPIVLLKEAKRVARKFVALKDHTIDGYFAYSTLRFMDWVGNAHHRVALPYNYWPEQRWREAFAELGLSIASWMRDLGLYPYPASLIFDRRLHFIAALHIG
jgi:SAM-dependent methyltransferase